MLATLIDRFIEELGGYCNSPWTTRPPRSETRARALLESVREARANNDLDLCVLMLASQLHLMHPGYNTGIGLVLPTLFHGYSGMMVACRPLRYPGYLYSGSAYCRLLRETFDRLKQNFLVKRVEAGVSIVHRIWLGSTVGEDLRSRIHDVNDVLEGLWYHPANSKAGQRPRSILWYDRRFLKTVPTSNRDMEFRECSELFSAENQRFRPLFDRALCNGEYGLASVILRYLAMEFMGGLHMGLEWRPLQTSRTPGASLEPGTFPVGELVRKMPKFVPTPKTVKVYTRERKPPDSDPVPMAFPFTIRTDGSITRERGTLNALQQTDSDLFYVGKPHLPLMKTIVQYMAPLLWQYAHDGKQTLREMPAGLVVNLLPLMAAFEHHRIFTERQIAGSNWLDVPGVDRFEVVGSRQREEVLWCPDLLLIQDRSPFLRPDRGETTTGRP